MELNIKKKCVRCLGSGIDDNVEPSITCISCGGSGYIESDKLNIDVLETILEDIKDKINHNKKKINDLQDTCDAIKAKVDTL